MRTLGGLADEVDGFFLRREKADLATLVVAQFRLTTHVCDSKSREDDTNSEHAERSIREELPIALLLWSSCIK